MAPLIQDVHGVVDMDRIADMIRRLIRVDPEVVTQDVDIPRRVPIHRVLRRTVPDPIVRDVDVLIQQVILIYMQAGTFDRDRGIRSAS